MKEPKRKHLEVVSKGFMASFLKQIDSFHIREKPKLIFGKALKISILKLFLIIFYFILFPKSNGNYLT